MKRTETIWNKLLPIENHRGMGLQRIPEVIAKLKRVNSLDPISIIPYGERFIVWDGHGRTTAWLLSGKIYIPSVILETDQDLKRTTRGTTRPAGKLDDFLTEYSQTIAPELARYGIKTFADYPLFKELVNRRVA